MDMDKERIEAIVKQLTTSERVHFIELLNEYMRKNHVCQHKYDCRLPNYSRKI